MYMYMYVWLDLQNAFVCTLNVGECIGVKRERIPTHKVVICSSPKRNDE